MGPLGLCLMADSAVVLSSVFATQAHCLYPAARWHVGLPCGHQKLIHSWLGGL